jgi:hypothetical protein
MNAATLLESLYSRLESEDEAEPQLTISEANGE